MQPLQHASPRYLYGHGVVTHDLFRPAVVLAGPCWLISRWGVLAPSLQPPGSPPAMGMGMPLRLVASPPPRSSGALAPLRSLQKWRRSGPT